MLTAEGCSSLLMLELTKPGTNDDVMSPEVLAEIITEPTPLPLSDRQVRAVQTVLDIPRFLNRTA